MRKLFFVFVVIGMIGCSKQADNSFQDKIKTEKNYLKENVEKALRELNIDNNYSIFIIYQENHCSFNNVMADEITTKRVFGPAEFAESIHKPNKLDGLWEEKQYTANYAENRKNKEKQRFGYFSVIIVLDNFENEKINKLRTFMNFSVANANRNDIINIISRKDFE